MTEKRDGMPPKQEQMQKSEEFGSAVETQEVLPIEKLRENVIETFDADERVKYVVAMGSSAEGKGNALSDLDVCVVLNDDAELNQMLSELDTLFPKMGKLVGYYSYNPYHFYAVFEPHTPLDIYFVSSSLYFTVRSEKNKVIVDHSNRGDADAAAEKVMPTDPVTPDTDAAVEQRETKEQILNDLFLKGFIRTFRLLSKLEKKDYPTLAYILNRIREEQVVPLLTKIEGYDIPHSKAIKLDTFSDEVRAMFVDTYCKPEQESCVAAVKTTAEMLKYLFEKASKEHDLKDLDSFVSETYAQINGYNPE